jgi:ribA/ribD-fused uncharacterized protein
MTIKFYKTNDPYGFLNNFKKARMYLWGKWWNNVETPYQAAKCINDKEREEIYNSKTPREARDLGQKVQMRYDWNNADPRERDFEYNVKDRVMYECVLAKFVQHHDLRKQLIETGDEELVEDSPVDSYWGCGPDGQGKNMLGKILMRVREELKGE